MKTFKYNYHLWFLIFIMFILSCNQNFDTDDFWEDFSIKIKEKFLNLNNLNLHIDIHNDTIKVGEKIKIKMAFPNQQYCPHLQKNINIKEGEVQIILDKFLTKEELDTNFTFGTPLRIFEKFDEYFDIKVIAGKKINVYHFKTITRRDSSVLEIEYIAKKPSIYYFSVDEISFEAERKIKDTTLYYTPFYFSKLEVKGSNYLTYDPLSLKPQDPNESNWKFRFKVEQ